MKERLWSKDFVIVIFLNFSAYLTHLMILSTFPFFINFLGYTESVSGMCTALFAIVAVVSRPFIGWLLDNGLRRRIMLISLCLLILMPLGYLLVYTAVISIVLTVVLRLFNGFAYGSANTAAATIASDIIPKSRFAEGLGMYGMSTALGTACAPILGEFLMNRGFPVLFIAATVILVVALVLFLTMKTPKIEVEKKKLHVKELFSKDALPASATAVFFVMTYGAQESYILKFAAESDSITLSGGLFFIIMAVFLLVARLTSGRVIDRRGEALFLYISCPMMTAALLLLAFLPGNLVFLIAGALSGYSFGCIEPSLQTMAVRIATPDRRGAANSTFLCSFDIGIGVGAAISGVLIDALGYYHMYAILSLTSLIALVVYLLVGRRHPSSLTWAIQHGQK